mgnify:CR=1 FL=1
MIDSNRDKLKQDLEGLDRLRVAKLPPVKKLPQQRETPDAKQAAIHQSEVPSPRAREKPKCKSTAFSAAGFRGRRGARQQSANRGGGVPMAHSSP